VRFSLSAGKKPDSRLEICPRDVENSLYISALSTILVLLPAAEFGAPFREQNGLGRGSAAEFGIGPAGCLFGIEDFYNN
jgi:hypothetical protein